MALDVRYRCAQIPLENLSHLYIVVVFAEQGVREAPRDVQREPTIARCPYDGKVIRIIT